MMLRRPCQRWVLNSDVRESITEPSGMSPMTVQFTKAAGSKCPNYPLITTCANLSRKWHGYRGTYKITTMKWFIKTVRNFAFQTDRDSLLTRESGGRCQRERPSDIHVQQTQS